MEDQVRSFVDLVEEREEQQLLSYDDEEEIDEYEKEDLESLQEELEWVLFFCFSAPPSPQHVCCYSALALGGEAPDAVSGAVSVRPPKMRAHGNTGPKVWPFPSSLLWAFL